jgi:hypothetical protein
MWICVSVGSFPNISNEGFLLFQSAQSKLRNVCIRSGLFPLAIQLRLLTSRLRSGTFIEEYSVIAIAVCCLFHIVLIEEK